MELFSKILAIVVVDLVMSGDNAVVIGMAAHSLPSKQKRMAIVFGAAGAVALRIVITSIATLSLQIPVLKLVGGLLLAWIAFSLLKKEEEEHEHTKVADGLRAAIQTILLADFIMSMDNAIAVAGVANGSIVLLVFGLVLSMPIVMFTGSIVAELINRLWWLVYVGSAVIVWTGAEMVLDDQLVHNAIGDIGLLRVVFSLAMVVVVVAFSHWFHSRQGREVEREPVPVPVLPDGSSDVSGI